MILNILKRHLLFLEYPEPYKICFTFYPEGIFKFYAKIVLLDL